MSSVYQLKSRLILGCFLVFGLQSQARASFDSTEYIWCLGLAKKCDKNPFLDGIQRNHETFPCTAQYAHRIDPFRYIYDVKPGDIVWVQAHHLDRFFHACLPVIEHDFILVISDGDNAFPSSFASRFDVNSLIEDKRVIHVFAQNVDSTCVSSKVSPIPIGIDFHTIASSNGGFGEPSMSPQDQENQMKELVRSLKPIRGRILRVFVDFHLSDYGKIGDESRKDIFNQVMQSGMVDAVTQKMPRSMLHRAKGQYAFSISPHGHGLDCHRTWEDLMLGCIVIVKTSSLDALYDGLPVVIIQDWGEINEHNLKIWLEKYADAFENVAFRKKLTTDYWFEKILAVQKDYRYVSRNAR